MQKSFSEKTIRIEIALRKGSFAEGGNTRVIEGLACSVSVVKPGLPEFNSATVKIWGLSHDAMTRLTTLSMTPLVFNWNHIAVYAGEKGQTLPLIFKGETRKSSADFNGSPDVTMDIEASTGFLGGMVAAPATAVSGSAKAPDLYARWAGEIGYTYKNEGISDPTVNSYFPGSPIDKMQKLARDSGHELIIDDNTVYTSPAGVPRNGTAVKLSEATGLIGYPTLDQQGITCKCLFNPAIRYGCRLQIESIVPKVSGNWWIKKVEHNISAYTPNGGPWETNIQAARYML